MGLDSVEFVMAVEETFRIEIPDEDAEKLTTSGKLHDYLVTRLQEQQSLVKDAPSLPCLSSAAFYRLRRSANTALALERRLIRPETELGALLGSGWPLKQKWHRWAVACDARFPSLKRPFAVTATGLVLAAALFLLGFKATLQGPLWFPGVPDFLTSIGPLLTATLKGAFLAGLGGLAFFVMTKPFERDLPTKSYKMRDLVEGLLARNPSLVHGWAGNRWNEATVWECICILLQQQINVPPNEVTRDKTFRELGMD